VAAESDRAIDWGVQDQSGILAAMATHAACLSEPTHRIVFHATPNPAAGMNPVAIGFSMLARKLLKRGTFIAVADLRTNVLAFIQ
jgi:hypothetical protein